MPAHTPSPRPSLPSPSQRTRRAVARTACAAAPMSDPAFVAATVSRPPLPRASLAAAPRLPQRTAPPLSPQLHHRPFSSPVSYAPRAAVAAPARRPPLLRRSSFLTSRQPHAHAHTRLHRRTSRDPPAAPPAPQTGSRTPVVALALAGLLTPRLLIAAGAVVAFALSAALGANDVANSLGTAVGTGAIRITTALAIGAVMELAGAVLFGSTVTRTISSGVVTIGAATLTAPVSYMLGMLAVLVGCTVWMVVATRFGLPVSSTHSVVGSLIGLGLVSGWGINTGAVTRIISSWFLSPLIGGVVAVTLHKLVLLTIIDAKRPAVAVRRVLPVLVGSSSFVFTLFVLGKGDRFSMLTPERIMYIAAAVAIGCSLAAATAIRRRTGGSNVGVNRDGTLTPSGGLESVGDVSVAEQREDVEETFKFLQVVTACLLAFSHGSNDVSNAVGPFAAMYSMWTNGGRIGGTVAIPVWVLGLGGVGISAGLGFFGRPVMETVGKKITKLEPTMGFSVEFSTALTVLVASELGLPVSTTHTLIGCIVGLGVFSGDRSTVNLPVLVSIAGSWGVTVPFSGLVTALFYLLLKPLLPAVPALL